MSDKKQEKRPQGQSVRPATQTTQSKRIKKYPTELFRPFALNNVAKVGKDWAKTIIFAG